MMLNKEETRETKTQILDGVKGILSASLVEDESSTVLLTYADGRMAVRYHHTDVVTWKPSASTKGGNLDMYDLILDSGGYRTPTTLKRMNAHSPYVVFQEDGVWYVSPREDLWLPGGGRNKTIPFYDGMVFRCGKLISGLRPAPLRGRAVEKAIKTYLKAIDELEHLPLPEVEDCWACGTFIDKGFGEHTEEHLREKRVFGWLLVQAMQQAGFKDADIDRALRRGSATDRAALKTALRQYFEKRVRR